MEIILRNFLEHNKRTSGLMLLPLTTGSGKTYQVLKYIANLLTINREKKVFFITTQKKNLPVEKLRSLYKGNDFDTRVLKIQSIMDCIKENLTDDLVHEITVKQPNVANSSKFKILVALRKEMLRIGDLNNNNDTYRAAERDFRNELLYTLKKDCKQNNEDIFDKIKTDKSWQWIGKLYPMVYTKERQVYFLSMDKFMLPYDTLVAPVGNIIDSEWFKGAYVFIDEFDATKDTIIKRIINDKNNTINLITLSKKITQGLKYTEFPIAYEKNENIIKQNTNNFNQLGEEFYLKYVFKTSDDLKTSDSFLFHDNGYWGQTTEKNLIVETDINLKQNIIRYEALDNNNTTHTLYKLLSKIQSKLSYFQNGVSFIAKEYANKKSVNIKTAVDSFLNLFLDYPYNDYISSQVMSILRTESKDNNNPQVIMDKFDLTFYKNGFRYTSLRNDEFSDAEQSDVILYAYNETPEAIMEKMAKVAKIVGISATATLKTVLGNYDIDYLKRKLLDSFYTFSEYEKNRINTFLDKAIEHYDRTKINVELTPILSKDYFDKIWLNIVSEEDVDEIIEKLNNKYGEDDYIKHRFFRISWAFKQFMSHSDIKSFLCFMNLHPKEDNELSSEIIEYIFDRIIGKKGESRKMICYLNKDDYDKNLENIKERLSNGEKLFVISVYKTLGTGQNPQYKIPSGVEVVKVNDIYESDEKDFDAIYLDKPTNIISNLYDTSKSKWEDIDFLKFVYEMEYLCQNGDISEAQKRELINAGSKKMNGYPYYKNKNIDFESMQPYKGLVTQLLDQGCGRIGRTNNKNKNIYIFADKEIANVIDITAKSSIPLSPEFKCFLDELEKIGISKTAPCQYEKKAKNISNDTSRTISSYLSWEDKWTPNKQKEWQQMRLYSLKHPTLTESEYKTFPLCCMYVELPEEQSKYWYEQSEDYDKIDEICFDRKISQEVSEAECQLQILMKIPNVKDLFEQNDYATSWKPGKYMMSPSLYSRIYKGALGEVIGKEIFKKSLGIYLESLEDSSVYEFFDYKIPDKPIYVDFKNWKEIDLGSEKSERIRSEIFAKAKKCNAKIVLIINICSKIERQIKQPIKRDGCLLYEIPQLYVENGDNVNLYASAIKTISEIYESKY